MNDELPSANKAFFGPVAVVLQAVGVVGIVFLLVRFLTALPNGFTTANLLLAAVLFANGAVTKRPARRYLRGENPG